MPPGPARPRPPDAPPTPARPPVAAKRSLRSAHSAGRLEALLADLGPQVQRGGRPGERLPRHPSGLQAIDSLLAGGFPGGRLSEIVGPPSSGRTSVALALLARTTVGARELAAIVDRADAFDPASAEAAGVDLGRVLWARLGRGVRTGTWTEALRCTERLLETEGIPLVLLDCGLPWDLPGRGAERIPPAAWTRLARLAASTRTALVVLSPERLTATQAELVLELQPTRPRFSGVPALFEQLEARALLVRHRAAAPTERAVALCLGTRGAG